VLGQCELSDAARQALTSKIKLAPFLAQLVRDELWTDALRSAAFGLPRASALWWGTLCLWEFYRPHPAAAVERCLAATVAWVRDPTEANRRAAYDAGQAAEITTPAGNLAMAVFFSEGSLSPAGQPPVPTKPHYLPQSLAAAVVLAVKQSPRNIAGARGTDFVRLALEVLAGRWPIPSPSQV
jgi:hypothetical protein